MPSQQPRQQIILSEKQWGSNFRIQAVPDHNRNTVIRILKKIYRTLWAEEKGLKRSEITKRGLFSEDQFYLLGMHRFYIPLVDIGWDSDHKTTNEVYSELIRSGQNVDCVPMTRYFYFVSALRHEKKKALVGMGIERATAFLPGSDFSDMAQGAQNALNATSGAADSAGAALGYREAAHGVGGADRLLKIFSQKSPARAGSTDELSVNETRAGVHRDLGGTFSHCILEFDGNVIKFVIADKHTFQSYKNSTEAKGDPHLLDKPGFRNKTVTYLRTDENGERTIEVGATTRHIDR